MGCPKIGRMKGRLLKRVASCLIVSTLLRLPGAEAAQSWVTLYPEVRRQTNEACQEERLQECKAGLQNLLSLVDGRPDIRCQLAIVEVQLGNTEAGLESLSVCARSHLDFAPLTTSSALQSLQSLPGYQAIQDAYQRGRKPVGDYEVRYSLNDPDLLTEDIAFDPVDGSFLVSSVRERKVVRIATDGAISDVITTTQIPMWGVFALALDTTRHILWATTTAVPQSPPYANADDGRSAVLRIDLRSRTLLGRYELSDGQPHAFGDMTVANDGEAFVSDGRGGGVYAIRPGREDAFDVVVKPGVLRSPQTPAVSPDKTALLVPDYSRGVARVELAGRQLTWLRHPPELALFGFDGFYLQGRTMLAVQNGTTPERVLVATLDKNCSRVIAWRVAVARVPGLGDPTHGVVSGRFFYFLANSGWDRVGADGQFQSDSAAAPAQVWRVSLPANVLAGRGTCRAPPPVRR
jgi:hypothetical protein